MSWDVYLEGFGDGFAVAFKKGYVKGFVEAKLDIAPPPAYEAAIQKGFNEYVFEESQRLDLRAISEIRYKPGCYCQSVICLCGR